MRRSLALLVLLLPAALHAQTDKEIRAAAALITPAKVLQRISVIADDSMGGRNTPSAGLEKTAAYLADNYKKWGLKPLGENGTYFQRYTIVRTRVSPGLSFLEANQQGVITRYTFDKWMLASGPMTGQKITGPVKIISGAVTANDIDPLTLSSSIVLFVPNPTRAADNNAVSRAIAAKSPLALITLVNTNEDSFKNRVASTLHDGTASVQGPPVSTGLVRITMHESIFRDEPSSHQLPDWNGMRSAPEAVLGDAEGVSVTIVLNRETISTSTAPNVVALVEGSDPVLKNEYVIFSGHMDHVGTAGDGVGGCRAKGADSICNGADDDGSGTTGILSVGEALANLKGKTKRSLIILNVSGEEKGLWGSAYFADHPTVPLDHVVADINMDMIGRNNPDSIVVIGKEHSDMGTTLGRVQAAHPELKLVAADDIWPQESFYSRSDHFNFARKGVPILFFFNGTHPQYHQADDEVKLIDTSKLARVAQLGFYLGVEIANTVQRPKWVPSSYQTIVVEQKVPQPVVAPKRP